MAVAMGRAARWNGGAQRRDAVSTHRSGSAKRTAREVAGGPARGGRKSAGERSQTPADPSVDIGSSDGSKHPAESLPEIGIDDFKKIELRIAKVLTAERVPKKIGCSKSELDLGPLGKRQVIAGIAELCTPESLVGKNVVLCAT